MIKDKKIGLRIAGGLVLIALSFFIGMKYANAKNAKVVANRTSQFAQAGLGGQGRAGVARGSSAGGGFTTGDILSVDDKSITVKLQSGGSKIVLFSPTTEIVKSVLGTQSDMVVGKSVSVVGQTNTDGSVTAQSITLRATATPANR